jgi:bifunctional non-homologous end joining protein LigD
MRGVTGSCESEEPDVLARSSDAINLLHRAVFAIVNYVFDLLQPNGRDLTGEPLTRRRAQLAKSVVFNETLRLSQELPWTASDVIQAIRAAGLEGVVAKHRASTYQAGERSSDWIKFKLQRQQEFAVGGFRGSPTDG